MTFLVPALLFALPLAALPVIIHLIHLYRRLQVKWAAMMFLQLVQRKNKEITASCQSSPLEDTFPTHLIRPLIRLQTIITL